MGASSHRWCYTESALTSHPIVPPVLAPNAQFLHNNPMAKVTALAPVSNDGGAIIDIGQPYVALIGVTGTAPFLFHRWSVEGVEAKSKAAKGSRAKKTDDLESYVYRNGEGELCIPGEYFRQAIIGAAKFRQDPRSPRKSAMDLFKAAIVPVEPLYSLRVTTGRTLISGGQWYKGMRLRDPGQQWKSDGEWSLRFNAFCLNTYHRIC